MGDPKLDAMYDDDDAYDLAPETWPTRAVETMPFFGQCLAWLSWRMPLKVYGLGVLTGIGGIFWIQPAGVTLVVVMSLMLFWGFFCRTNYESPWSFVVIQTKKPVPEELRRAARAGGPIPSEHPDASTETQT